MASQPSKFLFINPDKPAPRDWDKEFKDKGVIRGRKIYAFIKEMNEKNELVTSFTIARRFGYSLGHTRQWVWLLKNHGCIQSKWPREYEEDSKTNRKHCPLYLRRAHERAWAGYNIAYNKEGFLIDAGSTTKGQYK